MKDVLAARFRGTLQIEIIDTFKGKSETIYEVDDESGGDWVHSLLADEMQDYATIIGNDGNRFWIKI